MQGIREYNRKISSLGNTRKITSSMKMISNVKMKKYAKLATNSSPWWLASREIISDAYFVIRKYLPLFVKGYPEVKKNLIYVCSGDQGLCGSYNSRVNNTALGLAEKLSSQGQEVVFSVIGAKSHQFFRRRAMIIFKARDKFISKMSMDSIDGITEEIINSYKTGLCQSVWFVHTRRISSVVFEPVAWQILPLTEELVGKKKKNRDYDEDENLPLIDASPLSLAEYTIKEYLRAFIHNALIESSLSEHSSRSTAMDAATNSCNRMINHYTQLRNRARQAAITSELSEIITGKESLECA